MGRHFNTQQFMEKLAAPPRVKRTFRCGFCGELGHKRDHCVKAAEDARFARLRVLGAGNGPKPLNPQG